MSATNPPETYGDESRRAARTFADDARFLLDSMMASGKRDELDIAYSQARALASIALSLAYKEIA